MLVICDQPDRIARYRTVLAQKSFNLLICETPAAAMDMLAKDTDIAVILLDLGEKSRTMTGQVLAGSPLRDGMECIVVDDEPAAAWRDQDVEYLQHPFDDEALIEAVTAAYNLARIARFQLDEMRTLENALLEFRSRTLGAVANLIAIAQKAQGRTSPLRADSAATAADPELPLQSFVQEESRRAMLRDRIFGNRASSHAAWMLVLVTAEAQLAETPLTVKSAAYSAGLPLSSALRRINEMCDDALMTRQEDPRDARRSFVSLTPKGLSELGRYLSEVAARQMPPRRSARRGTA